MSSKTAILARSLSKRYQLYKNPLDRLKEALHPLRKSYHTTFNALSDVSFDIARGETVGIIGRNGAGKSTLLKILSGVLQPSSGEYFVNGRIASLLELGTGFNPELTGRENIFFNGMILGLSREELNQKLDQIIDFAEIGEFIERPVKIYSSGMFARLAFAVAFHIEPEILIVDEALAVGDMAFQKKCFNKFREIRESGSTILFVSHDPYQIKGYCRRALYLKNGECVAFGLSAEVVDAYIHDQEIQVARKNAPKPTQDDSDQVTKLASKKDTGAFLRITDVRLLAADNRLTSIVRTGEPIKVQFSYKLTGEFNGKLSFVFNLYRHDDLYICGATTVMDKIPSVSPQEQGTVTVSFPDFPLLAGKYKWRVAINDGDGLGIFTEAVPVCEFQVKDGFQSVGLINLNRSWQIE